MSNLLYKDAILDKLSANGNVAQFISFSPILEQRFARIFGIKPNEQFATVRSAIECLLQASPECSVNVRSFLPDQPQSHEFVYGIKNVDDAIGHVRKLADQGLFTIVNETIDVNDGGVSGVLQNGMVEFAPGVVPRFVEKSLEPVATLPKELVIKLINLIYCCKPEIDYPTTKRIEFSFHPQKRGWKHRNTIIWEEETVQDNGINPFITWPTAFSKHVGDKAYGLIIAHLLGFPVPKTTVFSRNPILGMFSFGVATGANEIWMRTCPLTQEPGKYTTIRGWKDPFEIMDADDPERVSISSCLAQQEVRAKYSGALISTVDGPIIEGVIGFGDNFMTGKAAPAIIPKSILKDIGTLYQAIKAILGPIRLEWVHDGNQAWILQLHVGSSESFRRTIYPGSVTKYVDYFISDGLESLRSMLDNLETGTGIIVHGNIGMSSHIADVLRKAKVPSSLA